MNKNHILTVLFLACPVALLNAMDKEEKKAADNITFTFVAAADSEKDLKDLYDKVAEIYPKMADTEEAGERSKKIALEGSYPSLKKLVEQKRAQILKAVPQGEDTKAEDTFFGYFSYEKLELEEDKKEKITIHLSPIPSEYRTAVCGQALAFLKQTTPGLTKVYVGADEYLTAAHDEIKLFGFKEESNYSHPDLPSMQWYSLEFKE